MQRVLGLLTMLVAIAGTSGCGLKGEEVEKEIKVYTTKWDDGSVRYEYQYYDHPEDDRRIHDGWYHNYYKNGKPKQMGAYKEGERDGKWVSYYDTGKTYWLGYYADGEKSGQWAKDYQFGRVIGNYVAGKEEGIWIMINEEGHIHDEDIWTDGECVEMCEEDDVAPVPYFPNE